MLALGWTTRGDWWGNSVTAIVKICALIAVLVVYLSWGKIVSITADATSDGVALWIYGSDAARGGSVEATVRIDGGARATIQRVIVEVEGDRQVVEGQSAAWGDEITASATDHGSETLDFAVPIPEHSPGSVRVRVSVYAVTALVVGNDRFSNHEKLVVLDHELRVFSPRTSTLRRLGRAGVALGAALAVILLLIAARRWYSRRRRRPGTAWVLLLIPFTGLGYFAFTSMISDAVRVHGVAMTIVGFVTWYAILAVPSWLTGPIGQRRYVVSPVALSTVSDTSEDPYRSPHASRREVLAHELEGAWYAAGLSVKQRRRRLHVGLPGVDPAVVKVPESGVFGNEPFEILASDRHTVAMMLDAVAPLLGDLRCCVDGEPELRPLGTGASAPSGKASTSSST